MDFHSMKRKELQALCKKHKIPANLKNSEMANWLTSLLKGEDMKLGENGREIESDVENKRVKKVRFSPETQTFEFQKSEVKYVTRSRGRRLVGKGTAAKKKEGKGGIKNEASRSILPSDVENKGRVMTRKSLRRREVVDWGKSKNEDMERGLKKKGRERNLRQGKDKARDNIAQGSEREVEFMEIGVEKVFRRSKRNATKVEDHKLMSSEAVAAGNSLKPINRAATEAVEEKEKSPVVLGLRRSTRNASSYNEPLITLDDLVADVNYERKRKRQRRDPVEEHETVLVDRISIELPLAPLSLNVNSSERAVPESVVGNFAQKAEREPKKQTVEIEDSLCKDLTSEELPDVDVQPSLAEVTEGAIARDSEYKSFMDNLKKQKRRSGSSSGRKSPPKAQDSSKGVNLKITASESIEMDNIEPGVGTSHCRTNEIDQSGSTDSKGIQVWVELSIDMETMSRPASFDHLVEDERISSVKSQEYIKDQGFERLSGNGLERDENASLNGLRERDRSTSSIKDKISEGNPANVKDAVPNYNGDCTGTFNLGRALMDHQDSLQNMQTNNVEIDDMSGDRNVDQEKLICSKSGKSDKSSKENYDTTVTRMLGDENDNGGEIPEQPACLEMKHLGALSTDDNVTETSCSRIEYGTLISSSETIENVPELNSTLDDPASESSIDVMDYKPLEPRKQSPNIQLKDVGPKDATEAERHFEDAKISADLPKLDEKENTPDKYLESNPFDSSRCKLNMLGDIDANVGKGFVGDVDSEKFNLATEAFAADTMSGNNNVEGVDVTKLQKEVVAVEAGDTSVEGIPSPLSDNDAQELVLTAGDELFAENGTKEDSYRISEKISNFASSEQPSKANFNVNNFQEEFSCKDQENNGDENQENLTSIFSQVQFAMPEIHGEDKIVNIVDDVSSNLLYKKHEILKESDVADTINEYIESESTMNPSSLRIDDTSDTLKISLFTKVLEPEDKVAEERNDIITGRKSELSLERDQEKGAADLEETALKSAKISDSKPTTTQRKNSDIVADKNIVLGQQLTSEMWEKDMRTILIHGTPRKLQMAADMKENLPSFKIEKVGSLTTVKPTAKRTALKHVFIQKK